ncbi:DegV family protein [Proteinivorax hydrogeniformans]|uniref:DegV family protein n=1 Tax=Proteinivorax hydrogeniformans TaxID=1826727 RepID=A0AAU8HR07_9FIRM
MGVSIVIDSTADLPIEEINRYSVNVVPLNVHFGESLYKDGVDLSSEEFFHKLKASKVIPRTSQPSPADFHKVYKPLVERGDTIISIHISKELSGTYQSAVIASNMFDENADITVFDSKTASVGLGMIAYRCCQEIEKGADKTQILKLIEQLADEQMVIFGVDTLEFLNRSGRIGKASAMIGTLLNVKPILTVNSEGLVAPMGKIRGNSKIFSYLIQKIKDKYENRPIDIIVGHAASSEKKEKLVQLANKELNIRFCLESDIGSVIGTNTGPGVLGLVAQPVNE